MRTSPPFRSAIGPVLVLTSLALLLSTAAVVAAADAPPETSAKAVDQSTPALPVAEMRNLHPINFANEVLPILRSNCLACHNAKESKSGLVLETPKGIRAGGESGPAALPGKSEQSPLLIAAAHRDKPFMPPRNNKVSALPLTPEQLGVLKLWIDQGAGGDETLRAAPIQWHALPARLNPIYAVALSPDGQYAVCSRANQIFVYDIPARQLVTRLTDPSLVSSPDQMGVAHRDLVQSLAFSPDGRTLVSGGYREVKFWARPEPAILLTLTETHAKGPGALVLSPSGKTLAVIGDDNIIRLYGLPSGKLLRELKGHTGAVTAIGFAEGGARVYSGSLDKTLRSWPTSSVGDATVIETPTEVTALVVLANGQVVTAGTDKFLRIWEDGKQVKQLAYTSGPITMLAAADDAARFISASKDGAFRVWDTATGKTVRQLNQGDAVTALAIRPDGKRFASLAPSGTGRIWSPEDPGLQIPPIHGDLEAMERLKVCERRAAFASNEVAFTRALVDDAKKRQASETLAVAQTTVALTAAEKAEAAAKSAAESTAASKAALDKAVAEAAANVDQAAKDKEAIEKAAALASAAVDAFRPKRDSAGAQVDSAPAGDQRKAAQAAFLDVQKTYDDLKSKANSAAQARDAADQNIRTAGDKQRSAQARAVEAGKVAVDADTVWVQAQIALKSAKQALSASRTSLQRAGQDAIDGTSAQHAAEAQVAAANADLSAAQKAVATAGGTPVAAAFTADGGTLLTAGGDDAIRAWSAETGRPAQTLHGTVHNLVALSAGPQGIIAAAGSDGSVQIWNMNGQWKLARTLGTGSEDSPLIGRIYSLAFSPDGLSLATGSGIPSRTGELKLWSVQTGKLTHEFVDAHSDTILGLSFSADGKYIASCAADKFMKVFALDTGKLAHSFEGHSEHVLGVSFRYDGRALVTAGADNLLRFWNMLTGEQKNAQQQRPFPLQITSVSYIGMSDIALITIGDGTVRLVREEGTVRNFDSTGTFLYCGAATPDGQIIAAGGQDSILRIWEGRDDRTATSFPPPADH